MTLTLRQTLGVAALAIASVLIFAVASPADASGAGSPEVCSTGLQASGSGDLQTYTAPDGFIVSGVCVKAGELHTQLYTEDFLGACYAAAGIGTQTVEVERWGAPGPSCQEISHVDVQIEEDPGTTTTTTEPSTTTTAPSSTTTTDPGDTTTTAPPDTTTTEAPTTTPATLPFTGPAEDVALTALAASALVGLGLAALKRARD